jgi:hypothetical protein
VVLLLHTCPHENDLLRFIPDHMTETAVQDRLVFLMETDWKAQAEALLVERLKEGGDAYVCSIIHPVSTFDRLYT